MFLKLKEGTLINVNNIISVYPIKSINEVQYTIVTTELLTYYTGNRYENNEKFNLVHQKFTITAEEYEDIKNLFPIINIKDESQD